MAFGKEVKTEEGQYNEGLLRAWLMSNERIKVVKGDIPESLHLRFKILCAKNSRTMSDVLAELVEAWVTQQEEADRKKP